MIERPIPRRHSAIPCGIAAFFVLSLATAAAAAPALAPADSALATYDGGAVYPHDFTKAWWKLSPPDRPPGDALTSRRAYLVSVVNRQLFAREARTRPLVLTPAESLAIAQARDQMIQNALFGDLTKNLPPPSSEDVERYKKQKSQLAEIRFVTFKDWQRARSWKSKLTFGTPMSELDAAIQHEGSDLATADSFRFVAAEQIPDTLATVIWSLRPGAVSEIMDFAGQPTVILVRSFLARPSSHAGEDLAAGVEMQRRQLDRIRERYRQEFAARTQRTFEDANMQFLLDAHLKLKPRSDVDSTTGRPIIRPNLGLPYVGAADTSRVLARTGKATVTIAQYLRFWGAIPPYARPEIRERGSLDGAVDRLALAPALLEEARARGLSGAPEVQELVDDMREGYAVDHFFHDNFEARVKVTEPALRTRWAADSLHYDDRAFVEPRLIVVDRKSLADSLATRLTEGASFAKLVEDYSIDPQSSSKQGAVGRVYKGSQDNFGLERAMFDTPVGKTGGPEHTPQGWVLWRIEAADPGLTRSFEQARWMVERDYRIVEADRLLSVYLDGLKKRKHLRTYPERVTATLGKGGPWD